VDAVTLGMAKSDARKQIAKLPTPSPLSAISGRMHRNRESVTLVVLGDSTGNETFEWVYLTAQWLAAKYPAYTVLHRLWNDTNQNYDSATTVHTGTGTHTLTIYNGSMPGANADYSVSRLALQVPVIPQAIIISYGYNSSAVTYRPINYPLVRAIRESFPFAAIAITAQGPRVSSDPDYANGLLRQQSNIDLAQSEGLGLINVMQAFLDNPTYAADWLQVDGLHPNAAGMQVWRDEVVKHFRGDSVAMPLGPRSDNLSQVWIPAVDFVAKTGTPTRVDTNDAGPYWSLPNAGTTAIQALVSAPMGWDVVRFYAKWLQVTFTGFTGANNGIRVQVSNKGLGLNQGYNTAPASVPMSSLVSIQGPLTLGGSNTSVATARTSYLGYTNLIAAALGNPFAIEVKRLGDDAADTNADAWLLLGVMAVRQS